MAATRLLGAMRIPRRRVRLRLILLLLLLGLTHAFPNGAGGCTGGQAAVGPNHKLDTKIVSNGNLADFRYVVRINDAALVPITLASPAAVLETGVDYPLTVSSTTIPLRGVLIRVESLDGLDLSTSLTPARDLHTKTAGACEAPIGGITHFNRAAKYTAGGRLQIDQPGRVVIDVTVVTVNDDVVSVFSYNRHVVEFVAPPIAAPVPTTTISPATAPVAEPTVSPVPSSSNQTLAPGVEPTSAPVVRGDPTAAPVVPVAPTPLPMEPTSAPVAPTTTPVAPVAPTTAPVLPVVPTSAPVVPVAPTSAPLPVAPTSAPVVPTTAPVVPMEPTTAPVVPVEPTLPPVVPVEPTTLPKVPIEPTTSPQVPSVAPLPTAAPSVEAPSPPESCAAKQIVYDQCETGQRKRHLQTCDYTAFAACVDAEQVYDCEQCVADRSPGPGAACNELQSAFCEGLLECECSRCGTLLEQYTDCQFDANGLGCSLMCESLTPAPAPAAPACLMCVANQLPLDTVDCSVYAAAVCDAIAACPECDACAAEIEDWLGCVVATNLGCPVDCTATALPTELPSGTPSMMLSDAPSSTPSLAPVSATARPTVVPTPAPTAPSPPTATSGATADPPVPPPTLVPVPPPTLAPFASPVMAPAPVMRTLCSNAQQLLDECFAEQGSSCESCVADGITIAAADCVELERSACAAILGCDCGACAAPMESYLDCAFIELLECSIECEGIR